MILTLASVTGWGKSVAGVINGGNKQTLVLKVDRAARTVFTTAMFPARSPDVKRRAMDSQ